MPFAVKPVRSFSKPPFSERRTALALARLRLPRVAYLGNAHLAKSAQAIFKSEIGHFAAGEGNRETLGEHA